MIAEICFYYLLFNGTLTFLFLLLYGYYCYLILFKSRISRQNKKIHADLINFTIEYKNETIEPLECKNCGSILELNSNQSNCVNCKTSFSLSANHKAILEYRLKLKSYIGIINNYVFKIKFVNILSRYKLFFRWHPIVLFIIFIITLFFIKIDVTKQLYFNLSGFENARELNDFIGYFYFSLIINCYACYTLPFEVNEEIAELTENKSYVKLNNENCNNCGATIEIKNQLIEICCYCGTQNYNHQYINKVRSQQSNLAHHLLKVKSDFISNYKSRFLIFAIIYTFIGVLPLLTIFLPILFKSIFY